MDKASLRRQVKMQLHALSQSEVQYKSGAIITNLIASIDWQAIERISCYQSENNLREVDTSTFIHYINYTMPEIQLDLIKADTHAALPTTQYDLIIVPLIGFDDSCNRLGRGGGWYDRFLSSQQKAQMIGLAFDCQRLDGIPVEDFDVELTDVITEA